jgi:hypothetical protein
LPDRLHSVSPCLIKISSPMRSIMSLGERRLAC